MSEYFQIQTTFYFGFLTRCFAFNNLQEASRIRQDAESTKVRSTSLKDQADMLFNEMSLTEQELAKYENQATIDSQLAADVRGTYMSYFFMQIYLRAQSVNYSLLNKKVGGGLSCTRDNTYCNKLFYCYSQIVGYAVKSQNFISVLFFRNNDNDKKKKCSFHFYCTVHTTGAWKSRWSKEYSKEGVG